MRPTTPVVFLRIPLDSPLSSGRFLTPAPSRHELTGTEPWATLSAPPVGAGTTSAVALTVMSIRCGLNGVPWTKAAFLISARAGGTGNTQRSNGLPLAAGTCRSDCPHVVEFTGG